MPEFIITETHPGGYVEHRTATDARNAKRIIAGLRGRYPMVGISVRRITATEDVSGDFAKQA